MTEQWISLQEASEITGASEAIILDTVNKYQNNTETLLSKTEHDELYLDKKQLVSLFPSSANPIAKEKIPGTVLRWFDELRRAYETSMQTMFKRVEQVKDEHKTDIEEQYQQRIDEMEQQHLSHLSDMRAAHLERVDALNHHINKLEKDTDFYQQQVIAQQNTIAQLNNRYDTVVLALKNSGAFSEKDITPTPEQITTAPEKAEALGNTPSQTAEPTTDVNGLVKQAYQKRTEQAYDEAVILFEQAALLGNAKAMGALGRSYFIGEGTEESKEKAIAWLYLASENGLEPAQKKVEQVKDKYPEQYQHGIELADTYQLQIKLNLDSQQSY